MHGFQQQWIYVHSKALQKYIYTVNISAIAAVALIAVP